VRRPVFIAEQARNASGLLGRLIAFIMARETWGHNQRAIEALHIEPSDHILDVGCGPGRSIAALAAQAHAGRVAGVDPSELMAEVAAQRNRKLVREGRADIVIGSAAALPFPDAAFDKALCVHVVYFWNDLSAAFREIARVLKPGGRLGLLFRTSAEEAVVRAFPAEVYRFPALADVVAPLEAAGFAVEGRDELCERSAPVLLIAAKRRAPRANGAPE
jgi:ubiquinone/menaquinone biosynthesis C-methylase UbiE